MERSRQQLSQLKGDELKQANEMCQKMNEQMSKMMQQLKEMEKQSKK